jgi:hypothetical protein
VPHDKEVKTDLPGYTPLDREVPETPGRRNATARCEPDPITRTRENVATAAFLLEQPPDPPEYYSPWAA